MKVGIIGAGGIARVHGPAIQRQPGASIVGVADLDLVKAQNLARELGNVPAYDDPVELLTKGNPDVVHVLVPPEHHASVTKLVLSHGANVLVEKPMATTLDAAEQMVAEAERRGLKVCANYNMLYDSVIKRARQKVKDGTIGRVRSVEVAYVYDVRRAAGWLDEGAALCNWSFRLNGGPLQDLMPHTASLVLDYIGPFGDIHIASANRNVLPEDYPDEIRVLIEGEQVTGSIHLTVAEAPDVITLVIRGTEGLIRADTFNGILLVQKRGSLPRAIERGLSGTSLAWQNFAGTCANVWRVVTGRFDQSGGIRELIRRYYESIQTDSVPPVSPDECLRVVELTQRIWPEPVAPPAVIRATACPKKVTSKVDALVTGASGFVGTHLVRRLLDDGQSVRVFVRPGSLHAGRLLSLDVEVYEADLADADAMHEACRGARMIFHAGAAMTGSWEDHEQTTVVAATHLAEAALEFGAERLIFFSSLAVFETTKPIDSVISEESPYHERHRDMGGYAWSKIEAEKLLFDMHREYGLPVTVVRPGIVIGPLGPVFFPHLGFRYRDTIIALFGRGDNPLPLTFVDNTIDGILRASRCEAAIGQSFNFVDDETITAREYIDKFATATGIRPRIIHLPGFLPFLAAGMYELAAKLRVVKPGATSRRQLRAKHHALGFSNEKAKAMLDWVPEIPLETGLNEAFQWYRQLYGPR